jgi:hypothetical protein
MSVFDEIAKIQNKQQQRSGGSTQNTAKSYAHLEKAAPGVYAEIQKILSKQQEHEDQAKKKKKREEETLLKDDIAPVMETTEPKARWFQKGAFSDGWQFGDLSKTILGTTQDIIENTTEAAVDATESLIDTHAYALGAMGILNKDKTGQFIAKELLQPNLPDRKMNTGEVISIFASPVGLLNYAVNAGDTEANSVLGQKGDSMVQSASHMAGSQLLQKLGVPAWLTMGVNSFGGELENAFRNDATYTQAGVSAGISAVAEAITEKLSGVIKFKGAAADEGLQTLLKTGVKNGIVRTLLKLGVDLGGEGLEEVASEELSALGKKLTYMKDKEWKEIISSEDRWDAFWGGVVMAGGMSGVNAVQSAVNGVDYTTGLTKNEEAVVNKLYNDEVAKRKADGSLKIGDRTKIYNDLVAKMKKGYIEADTIEEVLGGETYKEYKNVVDNETNLKKKVDELVAESNKLEDIPTNQLTGRQQKRRDYLRELLPQLQNQIRNNESSTTKKDLKSKLENEVMNMVRGDRLSESYAEKARAYQKLDIDTETFSKAKHADAAKQTVASAVELGANNTNRVRDLVEHAAQISGKTGKAFLFKDGETIKNDFIERHTKAIEKYEQMTNRTPEQNKALAEMKQLVEDVKSGKKVVNGENTADGIVLNIDSKNPLMVTVGHEVTHDTESTKTYDKMKKALFAYANTKGIDVQSRIEMAKMVYEGTENANAEQEVVADLVGEMLFTDDAFVDHLARTDTNVFQNLWNDIKNLVKMATPGSKEAKELANLEHKFEKAFKEANKAEKATDGVKESLSSIANTFFGDENMSADEFRKRDYRETQGYKDYVNQCLNNLKQTRKDFVESSARQEIEDSIRGIVDVAIAAKVAGYDIQDSPDRRNARDSKKRLLFSSLEPNSEYTTSHDISTICDKRKNFADIYDDIVRMEEAKGVPQNKRFFSNVDNYFYLHKLMADKGLTQPCVQCYVESMRKNLAPMANAFLRLVGETDPNNTANDQLYQQKGKSKGEQKVNNAKTREWVLEKLAEYDMTVGDLTIETLTTADGLAKLKLQAPLVYEAFNSFYGQSKPKMPKAATPFRFGELTALLTDERGNIKKSLVDKINSTGGFRLQSYSDFQIQNYTDVLQVLFEAGTLGLNGHAYTKVPAFLEATKNTNLKRNISIFMYKDGNEWKLDRNDSFPYSLDKIYDIVKADKSGNTSIIAVSQNADMSAWIMANDMVGYGIPFHKSGLKMGTVRDTIVREGGREIKGYTGAKDHTKQQTEVWAKAGDGHKALTKVKKGINIYSFWDFDNKSNLSKNELIKKNVERYIDACEDAGYLPKFREYVMNNGKVLNDVLAYSKKLGFAPQDATVDDISFEYKGYRIPYGYYKFLGDFGMFTPDGKAAPQQTLSLKDYDFNKAVRFFKDSETLRRNEILQQFSNGEERERYRNSDLNAEQLADIVAQKRKEVANSVVSKNSLSRADAQPTAKGLTGRDILTKQAPVQAPANYDVMGATPETNIESRIRPNVVEEEAPVAPVPVETAPVAPSANATLEEKRRLLQIEKDDLDWMRGASGDYTFEKMQAEANIDRLEKEIAELESAPVAPMDDIAPVAENAATEDIAPMPAVDTRREVYAEPDDIAPVDGKRRKWIGTSTESEVVDGQILPDDLDQELIHYQPISNKKTLGNANSMLDSMGYESSVSYMNQRFASSKVSLDDIALGERLIQEAVKRGDTETAKDLIMDISILGTELGQKVQALSIIKRLTPEGQLKMLMRTVERGKAKNDKAFEGVEVTNEMAKEILDTRNADGTYDQDKLNTAVENVKQKIAKEMKSTILERINEWRYLSMLGNPKTHIRNLVSNVAMYGTRQFKNAIARTGETLAGNKIERTKTWQRASKEVRDFAKQVASQEYGADKTSKYSEAGDLKSRRQVLKIKALDVASKANSAALSAEDTWFSKPAYRQALQEYLTANGIRTEEDIQKNGKLIAEAKQYAKLQAQEATFQQDSYIASKISEIERKNPLLNVAVGSIMPFKKTPINIAKTGLAYSPLGFARNVYDAIKVSKGEMNASTAIDHFAQTLTGTSLALIGYALASRGALNGAGKDDKEGKYDYQLGKQSYSFNFDGDSFSLSWLSPVAMPLFVGANAYEILVEDKDWDYNVVGEALAQTLDPMNEMSFLSSLTDVLSSYDSGMAAFGGMLESAGQSYITSFVPTLFSQIAQVTDDKKRSTKIDANSGQDFLDETWNQIKYKIPGLRQTLEPSTDVWGNEIPLSENAVTKALETFILPYSRKDNIATKVDEEIKEVYRLTGENGVIPNVPYNYINYKNEKYEMTAAEHTEFKKVYGQTAYNLMEDLIYTDTYRRASAEDKAKMMDDIFTYAADEAKREFFDGRDVEYANTTEDNVPVYKENAIKGAIDNDMTVEEFKLYRDNPEKAEVARAIGGFDVYSKYHKDTAGMSLSEKADYVGKMEGLSTKQKNLLINSETDRKEPIDLTGYEKFKNFEQFEYAKKNPTQYAVSKAISKDFSKFYGIHNEVERIKAENDSSSGTKDKDVVRQYIFSLDLDEGQKALLYRSLYSSKSDKTKYNRQIVEYLDNRDDISWAEMKEILIALDFTITDDNRIKW